MSAAGPGAAVRLGRLDRLAGSVAGLGGWRRLALAAALGALAAAAQPPVHLIPVLIASFAGLVWLLDGASGRRRAFVDGWLFGAGYFAAGLYWVSNALLVDAARFGWLIPVTVLGLSFGLGLFAGAATLLARLVWPAGFGRALVLAASWALLEWVRGVVLTGFPWNPVGNVWTAALPVLQAASWIGVYGLSALTVFAAAAFASLASAGPASSPARPSATPFRRWTRALSGTAVLAALAAAGAVRLAAAPQDFVDGVTLRIVQPNISQQDKWGPGRRLANYRQHLALSGRNGDGAATHVIWPETAAQFGVTTDPGGRQSMRQVVPPGGALITGAPRYRLEDGRLVQIWNSLVAVDETGSVAAVYDKHHLVPFGEYMPFRDVLPLDKITAGALDFSAGPGPVALDVPGLPPFSPLICYEAIFPGAVVGAGGDGPRPRWLLNVTNDGWFGISAGPYQHFASARLRAVEEGLPLVRSANTGISAVVDPYGRVVGRTGLGERRVLDIGLPEPAVSRTPFSRAGDVAPGILVLVMLVAGAGPAIRNFRRKKETI